VKPIHDADQLANARKASAKAARERHTKPKTVIDWDAAIERLTAMLDGIDGKAEQ